MTPTLNLADLKLLKSVFLTKQDLVAMEKRLNLKFTTKVDLEKLKSELTQTLASKKDLFGAESRLVSKKDLEQLEEVLAKYFAKLETRLSTVEQKASFA